MLRDNYVDLLAGIFDIQERSTVRGPFSVTIVSKCAVLLGTHNTLYDVAQSCPASYAVAEYVSCIDVCCNQRYNYRLVSRTTREKLSP